ncbi:MAG: DUF309 domain-containing protein, partial [Microcoleus sp. SIO2G3]|nr:DUF309 domain-containing protein [Microcoleus sp. SIO2G3]
EGIGRLGDYQPVYEGVDVTELMTQSVELLKALQETGAEQVADFVKQLAVAETNDATSVSSNAVGRLPKISRVD